MDLPQAIAWISAPRFQRFLDASDSHEAALDLYVWHAEVTAACFEVVHHFEVILRNAIDSALGEGQPQEPLQSTWLMDFGTLAPGGIKQVISAVERLEKGVPITRGRVVAGLPFGFWAGLFGGHYEELWRHRLRGAFPSGSGDRKDMSTRMPGIRQFRNRLAHHDCILDQNIAARHEDILTVVGWADPAASRWLDDQSRVTEILARRPQSLEAKHIPNDQPRGLMALRGVWKGKVTIPDDFDELPEDLQRAFGMIDD